MPPLFLPPRSARHTLSCLRGQTPRLPVQSSRARHVSVHATTGPGMSHILCWAPCVLWHPDTLRRAMLRRSHVRDTLRPAPTRPMGSDMPGHHQILLLQRGMPAMKTCPDTFKHARTYNSMQGSLQQTSMCSSRLGGAGRSPASTPEATRLWPPCPSRWMDGAAGRRRL